MNIIEDKHKLKIALQPFNQAVLQNRSLYFPCTNCSKPVQVTAKVQKEMCTGGLGHRCNSCNTYFSIINCPNCQKITGFDDKEWELLVSNTIPCPNCNVSLFRETVLNIKLSSSATTSYPELKNWSLSDLETNYISNISTNFDEKTHRKIATRHHTVEMRMTAARRSLEYIESNKWNSGLVMSNTPDLFSNENNKTPFDFDFQNNLFSFINNLRSALDILSQEIAIVGESVTKEQNIEFGRLNTYLTDKVDMDSLVKEYKKSNTFTYLNKLRNVLQHRRIPLLVTEDEFDLKALDSIKPVTINPLTKIRLPDDPSKNEEEYTFVKNIELFSYLRKTMDITNNFILNVYSKLSNIKPTN